MNRPQRNTALQRPWVDGPSQTVNSNWLITPRLLSVYTGFTQCLQSVLLRWGVGDYTAPYLNTSSCDGSSNSVTNLHKTFYFFIYDTLFNGAFMFLPTFLFKKGRQSSK